MSRTVWKYMLPIDGWSHVIAAGRFVHVAEHPERRDALNVWIETEPGVTSGPQIVLLVVPTGGPIPPGAAHLASVVTLRRPPLVWHVYRHVAAELEPAP